MAEGTQTSICGRGELEIRKPRLLRGRAKSCESSSINCLIVESAITRILSTNLNDLRLILHGGLLHVAIFSVSIAPVPSET